MPGNASVLDVSDQRLPPSPRMWAVRPGNIDRLHQIMALTAGGLNPMPGFIGRPGLAGEGASRVHSLGHAVWPVRAGSGLG